MASRWRPQVGDRVHRRWRAWLGVGTVEDVKRGSARVRFAEVEGSERIAILFCTPSHLTREGLRIDAGPGRDSADVVVGLDRDTGRPAGFGPLWAPSEEADRG